MISFARVKDLLAGCAAKAAIQHRLNSIGTMLKLEIDSIKKTIRTEIHLKGEAEPVTINVGRYELIEESGRTFLELEGIDVSREWMQLLIDQLAKGRRVEVPNLLKAAL